MKNADINWKEGGVPASRAFDDIYYSVESGLEESRAVFQEGNDLRNRWRGRQCFTVGELGFGTGLNFLCVWKLWRDLPESERPARLHFVSIEGYPLRREDLARALEPWAGLAPLSDELLRSIPSPVAGTHSLSFEAGRVNLTLIYRDAAEALLRLDTRADAWFLDGFAPGKNPGMWAPEVLAGVVRSSATGATFATFTAASQVRRGLEAAGFEVWKRPGFGRKREMLAGRLLTQGPLAKAQSPGRDPAPWFRGAKPAPRDAHVVVIGGGLAGTSTLAALVDRGYSVTLIEREAELGTVSSGNAMGVVMPNLTARPEPLSELSIAGVLATWRRFQRLRGAGVPVDGEQSGVVQFYGGDRRSKRYDSALGTFGLPEDFARRIEGAEVREICGFPVEGEALYFGQAGWIDPGRFARALVEDAQARGRVEILKSTEAISIARAGAQWRVAGRDGREIACGEVLVVANAADALSFSQLNWLALRRVRGQVVYFPATEASSRLRLVVNFGEFVTPALGGMHVLGATFDRKDLNPEYRQEEETALKAALLEKFPAFFRALGTSLEKQEGGRVGFRTVSRDMLPVVGPVPDYEAFLSDYAGLKSGRPAESMPEGQYHGGLYVSLAHAARGLVYAPVCGELLAAQISGDGPLPLERDTVEAVSPARYPPRWIVKGFPET